MIPNKTLTLAEGAIEPWTKPKYRPLATEMRRYARAAGVPLDVPWQDLTADQQSFIISGDGKFWGVRGFFEHLERKKYKLHVRVFLSRYRGYSVCSECSGLRLRREARQVKIGGKDICQVTAMTVEEATRFFSQLELSRQEADIAGKLLEEINDRLRYLNDVGLEYLTLDRLASTLSGGEAQRIQLATSLGSRLVGTLYVLDEPSIGLHSRDTARLIKILHDLRDLGNTILVVEHDAEIMRSADRILDLGPGAGENGGRLIASGTYDEILHNPASLTGRYLNGELRIQPPRSAAHGHRPEDQADRRARPQSEASQRRHSAGHAGLHHRSFGLGQIDAGARCALQRVGRGERPGHRRSGSRGRARGRRGVDRRSRAGRSVAHRAHAALQSGDLHQSLRCHPRAVRFARPRARSAVTPLAISRSTFPAAAAKPARATARSRSRCSFSPTSN